MSSESNECSPTSPNEPSRSISVSAAHASAWNARPLPDGTWRWVAWSDWTRASQGLSPEVHGLAEDEASAAAAAIAAARSMNPSRWLRILAESPLGLRRAS